MIEKTRGEKRQLSLVCDVITAKMTNPVVVVVCVCACACVVERSCVKFV